MFGDKAQRHFAQRGQIAFLEEILRGPIGPFAEINFSFGQTRPQLLRR